MQSVVNDKTSCHRSYMPGLATIPLKCRTVRIFISVCGLKEFYCKSKLTNNCIDIDKCKIYFQPLHIYF
jgi:hypothetical protein